MRKLLPILLLFAWPVHAQTSVALSPVPAQQFFSQAGQPLASGCIYTYITGTSTPLATYTDGTGVTANSNPVILDGGGFGNLWLSNSTYRFTIYSKGAGSVLGTDCYSGSFQRTVDYVSAYAVINQAQSIFLSGQSSDPAGTAGELIYRTDIPCIRAYTTFWDCLVSLTGTQTLLNKTLTAPALVNATGSLSSPSITGLTVGGVSVATGNPTNFQNFTNGGAGTTLNSLVKLVALGAGTTAVNTAITDTGGVVGVVIAGAGTSGINLVQSSGQVLCAFDGSTTVEDYVQISPTVAGDCHDAGAAYPSGATQAIGRVLTTNAGAGSYLIELFPPEIHGGGSAAIACTNFTPFTVTNNNAQQNLLACTIPANALAQGNLLNVDITGVESTASNQTLTISASVGGGTACVTTIGAGVANNQPWNYVGKFAVLTSGAGGTANWSCEMFITTTGPVGPFGAIGTPTISVNTTISNTLQIFVQMSVANAGNATTGQLLKAVVY